MRSRSFFAVIVLLSAVPALAASNVQVDGLARELPIEPSGTLWLNNPFGSIDVVGVDGLGNKAVITIQRIVNALDDQAVSDAREAINTTFEGDSRVRLITTVFPEKPDPRWKAIVSYTVRVPRSVNIKIASRSMDHIRVSQVQGSVTVKTFSGTIILSNVSGASTIDTVNGRVIYDYPERPTADARVVAINADIDIYAPRESFFDWIADTIKGDLLTTFDVRGLFHGNTYHGHANTAGGPTLMTNTLAGRVMLLARGTSPAQARRIVPQMGTSDPNVAPLRKVQIPFIYDAFWAFQANVADVSVGEIRGSTRIETGAGEVELGVVYGNCVVNSHGGPLNLGDMIGTLDAHTGAGDVMVRVARQGGNVSTDGGIVRVVYAGGPMSLRSGGGDIIVQQAVGPIDAATRSGDINITVGPQSKTQRIMAKTQQGNITLNVSPNFAADIDALLLTDDSDASTIHSDFNLTLRREAFNGKTRIHATGKINGGGERIELVATDGSINISSQVITPMVIASPRP